MDVFGRLGWYSVHCVKESNCTLFLQDALCTAYVRIVKVCPPLTWQLESLVSALYHAEPFLPLIECFRVALSSLGPHLVGTQIYDKNLTVSTHEDNFKVGEKRPIQELGQSRVKRKKINEDVTADANVETQCKYLHVVTLPTREDFAHNMNKFLLSFIQNLKAPAIKPSPMKPDIALSALSMLCIVFSMHPDTDLSLIIFQQMFSWLPWIVEQVH